MRSILLLLVVPFLGEALADQSHETYEVQVDGGTERAKVVAIMYDRKGGQTAREQLGVRGPDSEKLRVQMALLKTPPELVKFTKIPGITEGKSESVSTITIATNRTGQPSLGQKLRLFYGGEMIGEIPGNPLCEMTLSGFDHGHRGPTVSKVIAVSGGQLLLVVEQKGYGGRVLDKVYRVSKDGEGDWLVTELGIGEASKATPANQRQK